MNEMSEFGKSLIKAAGQALAYARGETEGFRTHIVKASSEVNVRAIRTKLHMTRREFADRFGFSIRTLEKWEQGVRQPEGAVRAYLKVIARNSKAVEKALEEE